MRKILKVEGINDKKVIEKLLGRRKIGFENFEIQESPNVERLLNVLPDMIRLGNYDVIGVILEKSPKNFKKIRICQYSKRT
ncbi:hypothetical protein U14_04772 [Candidatus Moduliflexus flocculans]|uniref:Uncharacterized protein n=1 Tax=Candidatus Moduliflexus flocculans TaxID=1499966 RepID=A0A0S6W5V5_9BACT|nr:hypothetical protein U14_04772 [Candidatus Moduliflexus flocculans]